MGKFCKKGEFQILSFWLKEDFLSCRVSSPGSSAGLGISGISPQRSALFWTPLRPEHCSPGALPISGCSPQDSKDWSVDLHRKPAPRDVEAAWIPHSAHPWPALCSNRLIEGMVCVQPYPIATAPRHKAPAHHAPPSWSWGATLRPTWPSQPASPSVHYVPAPEHTSIPFPKD